MNSLGLLALLVYTFGALTYGSMVVLWVREMGRLGWAARTGSEGERREVDGVNGALLVVTFLWFCGNTAVVLLESGRARWWALDAALITVAFAFPPIIMHLTWSEVARGRALPRGWRLVLWPAYALCLMVLSGALGTLMWSSNPALVKLANTALTTGLSLMFVCTAVYSSLLLARHGNSRDRHRRPRHALMGLFGVMAVLFIFILLVNAIGGPRMPNVGQMGDVIEITAKSLPLIFMFVGTYYENRFRFFDLLVKRGAALLVALGGLTLWFAAVMPRLAPWANAQWAAPWLYAVTLLPVVAALPWLHGRIAQTLDRRWLGRRFTTVDAVKRFLEGLRSATTESQLIAQAQAGLHEIFGAPAIVAIGTPVDTGGIDVQQRISFGAGESAGVFLMGPRDNDAPYFSGDVALLSSLADVFASVMQNLQLQARKLEQEQRARELSLHASRSELKALRAQINPHFLFNALNAIAGLIHRDPAVADRTIEQLADVFRYALRGAESEWAVLDDELDFVRAYLEVERARFGDRLDLSVSMDDGVRGARVPTMVVQTLVENAVKHGAATVRGRAVVHVHAGVRDGRLALSVTDNGPGFTDKPTTPTARGGYGLLNIRQRLEGYFSGNATLAVSRDEANAFTVVSVELPLLREEPRR